MTFSFNGAAQRLIDEIAKKIRANSPVTIGFVCAANKHRSAAAEILLKQRLKELGLDQVKVRSAGLSTVRLGFEEAPLWAVNPELCKTARAQEIDPEIVESFSATQVSPEFIEASDLILAAGPGQGEFLEQWFPGARGKVVLFSELAPDHPVIQGFGPAFPDPQKGIISIRGLLALIDQTIVKRLLGARAKTRGHRN